MCLPPKADKYHEFLDRRKSATDNIVSNFESFKHGYTEESIQVPNYKENLKGEKDFEIFVKIVFLMSKILCFLHL